MDRNNPFHAKARIWRLHFVALQTVGGFFSIFLQHFPSVSLCEIILDSLFGKRRAIQITSESDVLLRYFCI